MTNIFKYLKKKKNKPFPFEYKLLNNLPLTKEELTVNGNLVLSFSKIKSLPNDLIVYGYLNLYRSNITSLPNNLIVNGDLDLDCTKITSLPNDLSVDGDLYCYYTPLANIIKKDISLLKKYSKQVKGNIYYE